MGLPPKAFYLSVEEPLRTHFFPKYIKGKFTRKYAKLAYIKTISTHSWKENERVRYLHHVKPLYINGETLFKLLLRNLTEIDIETPGPTTIDSMYPEETERYRKFSCLWQDIRKGKF